MNIFGEKIHSFGLDISDHSLKFVNLEKKLGKLTVSGWNKVSLKEGLIKDGEIIKPTEVAEQINLLIKTGRGSASSRLVVASLPDSKTFLKVIDSSKESVDNNPMEKIIETELPKHIPMPLSELNYDWTVTPYDDKGNCSIIIAAAPLKIVRQYTEILYYAGLNPLALELSSQAISRAFFFNYQKEQNADAKKTIIIVDLGRSASQLILCEKGIIKFTNKLNFFSEKITKEIADGLNISIYDAERAKNDFGLNVKKGKGAVKNILANSLKVLIEDINKSIDFYKLSRPENSLIDEIIISGDGALIANLSEYLNQHLKIKISLGSQKFSFLNFNKNDKSSLKNFPGLITALGLALRDSLD